MQAFNKIGFHVGGAITSKATKTWLEKLDAAGIPFFLTTADSTSGLKNAQDIARVSTTKHTIVYRCLDGPAEPDYNLQPEAAARAFWQTHKAALPAELDPAITWIEPMQGVVGATTAGNWLGDFAFHLGQLTLAGGFRLAAFGFDTGSPEGGLWDMIGMLRYLSLCAEHPGRLGVALHEFSQRVDDIGFMWGEKIGRFQHLFSVCDKHNIPRPPVLITAWGWTDARITPVTSRAVTDIKKVAELYAQYAQILGAAIWNGKDNGFIFRQVNRLYAPLTEMTLKTQFAILAPQVGSGESPMSLAAAQPMKNNARFISDVTIPDDTRLPVGELFIKTWRIENSGSVAWKPGFKLVFVGGERLGVDEERPLPAASPGQQVEISLDMRAPDLTGTFFSDWRCQDADGNLFGDIIYVRIVAYQPQPVGTLKSLFLADVTIPDDTEIEPGTQFIKTWRIKNDGTRDWTPGFRLVFTGGAAMTGATSRPIPRVTAGSEVELSLELSAPNAPGTHFCDWRLQDDQGEFFGDTMYARIIVPSPAGASLTAPLSQNDPAWAGLRLGHAGSPQTIGKWGCLLTCFAMMANALGKTTNPAQLNEAMIRKGGFVNIFETKWKALSDVYTEIVYEGKFGSAPDVVTRINDNLANGFPVAIQVDFTRDTPYSDNDQHWVLIVGRDGNDYRINDPWLWPPQEASLRQRYGRAGRPLFETVMSAIFYRSAQPISPVVKPAASVLQTGININPDAPHSNPVDNDDLKGLNWVRLVFKLAARVNEAERGDIDKAFAQYDPIIRKYNRMGVNSLIIINQETVWHPAPWIGNNDWEGFSTKLADVAAQIARRYRRYGAGVAYQIWNEGDKQHNPASVFVTPQQYALILRKTAAAIRVEAPDSPIIFNGMATGPDTAVAYIKQVRAALGGSLPVDAIGVHPYTRWGTYAPFDWGKNFGTLADAFARYKAGLPGMKLWITEIGVADDNEIGSQHYAEIAKYFTDVYKTVGERFAEQVPVLIWFAWSDWMRNAGVVNRNGERKDQVYAAFRTVRNRELWT